VRACPRHAHWLDGEPVTPVMPMGGILDRLRSLNGNGAGPALGVLSLGDAWACTNPSMGRGMTLGLAHAAILRRVVREAGDNPAELVSRFAGATQTELQPWYESTVTLDRARMAEIDALRNGATPPPPEHVAGRIGRALPAAMSLDADIFRAGVEIIACLALPRDVFARPGLAQRVLETAAGASPVSFGPDRKALLTLLR
jgi:flavin-dependent dehydrogenase